MDEESFLSSLQVIGVLFKITVMLFCVPKHVVTLSLKNYLSIRGKLFSCAEGDIAKCTPLNINAVNHKKS